MNLLRIIFITIGIIGISSALPISLPTESTTSKWVIGSVFLLGAALVTVGGCLCCKRKKGFKEFNNEPGSATHTVNAESPFPIFRPLNQNQASQNGSGENQSEVTPLKHPDSPVLPHNNIESSNSGLVSQISNENNHLMIDEPIISPEHAVNIEAPRPVVDNIASIRSNMQIISNAIINIVTNDHMENDNNNGPISELDIQNIANNNAEGYIQNQNEIFQNQNLNVVTENYQNAGNAFINFNQNFVDLSSVPSTSGATNQISNDDQTTKSFGDSSNAGVVQPVNQSPNDRFLETAGAGDDVNEALRCLESVLSGESDCDSGSCSSLAEVQLEFNNDHFKSLEKLDQSNDDKNCDNENVVTKQKPESDNIAVLKSNDLPKTNKETDQKSETGNLLSDQTVSSHEKVNCDNEFNDEMVSARILNKENEHPNILSTVPGQPQNVIKIVDTDVSKDIICDIEAKNVQDNQEKHKFVKNTSNISSESLNPEQATSNIYLADDSTKIHVGEEIVDHKEETHKNVENHNSVVSDINISPHITPETNNCAGISDPNKLSIGTDQKIVCEITENTHEPCDEDKLHNLTSPKHNENCNVEHLETISLEPVQNDTRCTSDPDYFGISDSNKESVSSNMDQEIVCKVTENAKEPYDSAEDKLRNLTSPKYKESCKDEHLETSSLEHAKLPVQNDTRSTSDPDYLGISDSNKESVSRGTDQEIVCEITENTKEPCDSAEDKLQNLTPPKQNESCKDEHLETISLERPKLPVQNDTSSSVPDVSDDKLKSTESSDESNMQHETSPIATSKTTEKSDESFLSKKDSVEQILEENSGFDEQVFRTNSDTRNTPTILNRTFSLGYNDETPSPEIEPKIIDIDSFKTSTPSKKHKKTSLSESPKKSPRKPNYDFLKTGQINLESWDKFLGDSFERNNEDDDSVFDDCDKDLNSSSSKDEKIQIKDLENLTGDEFFLVPPADTTSDSSFKDLSENTDDNKENIKYQETSSSDTTDSDLKFHSTNSDEEQDSVKLAEIRRALILSLPDAQGPRTKEDTSDYESGTKSAQNTPDNVQSQKRNILGVLEAGFSGSSTSFPFPDYFSVPENEGGGTSEERNEIYIRYNAAGPLSPIMEDWVGENDDDKSHQDQMNDQKLSSSDSLCKTFIINDTLGDSTSYSDRSAALTSDKPRQVLGSWCSNDTLFNVEDALDVEKITSPAEITGEEFKCDLDKSKAPFVIYDETQDLDNSEKQLNNGMNLIHQDLKTIMDDEKELKRHRSFDEKLDVVCGDSPDVSGFEESTLQENCDKYKDEGAKKSVVPDLSVVENHVIPDSTLNLKGDTKEIFNKDAVLLDAPVIHEIKEEVLEIQDLVESFKPVCAGDVNILNDVSNNAMVKEKTDLETCTNLGINLNCHKSAEQIFTEDLPKEAVLVTDLDSDGNKNPDLEIGIQNQKTDTLVTDEENFESKHQIITQDDVDKGVINKTELNEVVLEPDNSDLHIKSADELLNYSSSDQNLISCFNNISDSGVQFDICDKAEKKYLNGANNISVVCANMLEAERIPVPIKAQDINSSDDIQNKENIITCDKILGLQDPFLVNNGLNTKDPKIFHVNRVMEDTYKIPDGSTKDLSTNVIKLSKDKNLDEKENISGICTMATNAQLQSPLAEKTQNTPVKKYLIKKSDTKLNFLPAIADDNCDVNGTKLNGSSSFKNGGMYDGADGDDDDDDENSCSEEENEDTISSNSEDYDTLTSSSQSGQEYELQRDNNEDEDKGSLEISADQARVVIQQCLFNLDGENDPWTSSNIKFSESDIMTTSFSSESPMPSPQTNECVQSKFGRQQEDSNQSSPNENLDDDTGCESEDTSEEFEWKSGNEQIETTNTNTNNVQIDTSKNDIENGSNETDEVNLDTTLTDDTVNGDGKPEISVENYDENQEYDNDDDESSDESEEIEFIPSIWNSSAVPSRSSLKSPENNTVSSDEC